MEKEIEYPISSVVNLQKATAEVLLVVYEIIQKYKLSLDDTEKCLNLITEKIVQENRKQAQPNDCPYGLIFGVSFETSRDCEDCTKWNACFEIFENVPKKKKETKKGKKDSIQKL